ncbi:Uncharacterised protein [Klebsiella pneumoniae]|nr:Uncharacterised protein [Klebsiella pneumoniae]
MLKDFLMVLKKDKWITMIEKIECFIVYIFNLRKINKMTEALVRLSNSKEMTEDELERFLLEERIEDMLNHE